MKRIEVQSCVRGFERELQEYPEHWYASTMLVKLLKLVEEAFDSGYKEGHLQGVRDAARDKVE